ncbi:MAG: hypothetical protein AAF192_09075 [Pseudomonadota bacterium]
MKLTKMLGAALAAAALAAPAPAAAQDEAETVTKVRSLGLGIGNAYVCTPIEGRDVFKEQVHHLFDLIVQDVGSDIGFIYATAVGYGSAAPRDRLDCDAMLAQWSDIVTNYELETEE